jgi:hypothetical protein
VTASPPSGLCGTCNMCCKVYIVPEAGKHNQTRWCPQARPGSACGCKIYDQRPERCADFACLWLLMAEKGMDVDPELRPDRSKVVVATTDNPRAYSASVDPGYPNAWREGPAEALIARLVTSQGAQVVVSWSEGAEKVLLRPGPSGVVLRKTITMSEPDENGVRWYKDSPALPGLGGKL